jgi:hypothetical protein
MKPKVYIETSVISYLTARRSRDLIVAANQAITQEWWDNKRQFFELFISEFVLDEIAMGDPKIAASRLLVVDGICELYTSQQVEMLAALLLKRVALPVTEKMDALHIAIATIHGMDYLLTWNCKHLANATKQSIISSTCKSIGYESPIICTPLQLIGV